MIDDGDADLGVGRRERLWIDDGRGTREDASFDYVTSNDA